MAGTARLILEAGPQAHDRAAGIGLPGNHAMSIAVSWTYATGSVPRRARADLAG